MLDKHSIRIKRSNIFYYICLALTPIISLCKILVNWVVSILNLFLSVEDESVKKLFYKEENY